MKHYKIIFRRAGKDVLIRVPRAASHAPAALAPQGRAHPTRPSGAAAQTTTTGSHKPFSIQEGRRTPVV